MGQQVRMTRAEVARVREVFEGLSAPEPEELGKRQIVLELLPSIDSMKQKGFTLAGIA